MPTKNRLRIGACVLATVLLGALPATQTVYAEEAGSGTHNSGTSNSGASNSGASNSGASNSGTSNSGTSNSGASNSGAHDSAIHDGSKASDSSVGPSGSQPPVSGDAVSGVGPNANDIDTRITVQPHRRPGAKADTVGQAKAKFTLPTVKNPHRRVFSASGASNRTVRNTVSVPISQQELLERRAGEHPLSASTPHPTAGAIGVVGHTALGMAKSESGFVRQITVPRTASPIIVNRGISGTSAGRRGVSSAVIGGPAKTVAGINGTVIRPAH